MRLEQRCRQTITEYDMLHEGDRIAVGVSGGADSVALLHVLRHELADLALRVAAVHVNHLLRGAESERDEDFVRRLCAEWQVPLTVRRVDVASMAAAQKTSVEVAARAVRYEILSEAAGEGGRLATAHTRSDAAETLLLNLARGTGLRGLCGIPPVRGSIIRPLIDCTREEVEGYCREQSLAFVTDSTNLSDDYTRNRIRHHVLPALAEASPALLRSMAATMDALRADEAYLAAEARLAAEPLRVGSHNWDAAGLLRLPEPLRRRILLAVLAEHGVAQSRRRVLQIEALLRDGGGAQLSGSWLCAVRGGLLRLYPVPPPAAAPVEAVAVRLPESGFVRAEFAGRELAFHRVTGTEYKENKNNCQNRFKYAMDCDKIDEIVKIRQREPGDRVRLAGRSCTKTLKKLFNEAGLDAAARSGTAILADGGGIIWVEGFGVAERACVDGGTGRVLLLGAESSCEEGGKGGSGPSIP